MTGRTTLIALATLTAALTALAVPATAAMPSCQQATTSPTVETDVVYVDEVRMQRVDIWQETSDVAGLQPEACVDDGSLHDADTLVHRQWIGPPGTPSPPADPPLPLPGICMPTPGGSICLG